MHYDVTPDTGRFYVVRHAAGRSTIEADCLTMRTALGEARRLNGLLEPPLEGPRSVEEAPYPPGEADDPLSLLVD